MSEDNETYKAAQSSQRAGGQVTVDLYDGRVILRGEITRQIGPGPAARETRQATKAEIEEAAEALIRQLIELGDLQVTLGKTSGKGRGL